jgi:hypothetical protein
MRQSKQPLPEMLYRRRISPRRPICGWSSLLLCAKSVALSIGTHIQDATDATADLNSCPKETVRVEPRATVFWVGPVVVGEGIIAMLVGRINDAWGPECQTDCANESAMCEWRKNLLERANKFHSRWYSRKGRGSNPFRWDQEACLEHFCYQQWSWEVVQWAARRSPWLGEKMGKKKKKKKKEGYLFPTKGSRSSPAIKLSI